MVDLVIMSEVKNGKIGILKTTFLFGFVQIARLLISVVKNKAIAMILGPKGVGTISIYNNALDLIKTGAGLGVSQSAVKDISEANVSKDQLELSRTISVINEVVLYTSVLGLVVTIIFSPVLSRWSFGDYSHISSYVLFSLAVFFTIYLENQLSILKGMRMLKSLAKATLLGSFLAIIVGLPSIFLWGEKGIVISLVASAIATAMYSSYYVSKIRYTKIKLSYKEIKQRASPMVKMGSSLMMSNFLAFFSNTVVLGWIQNNGGLDDVGFFHAGSVLVVSYFSMVTTAMNTDFYPRISECADDDYRLSEEIYQQSSIGLLIIQPLVVGFILLSTIIIKLLYTAEFDIVKQYTDIAIIGVVASIITNCYGYLIIVKRAAKFYLFSSVLFSVLLVPLYIIFYKLYNICGLGIAYTLDVVIQLIVYYAFCNKKYNQVIKKDVLIDFCVTIILVFISVLVREINSSLLSMGLSIILLISVLTYAYYKLRNKVGIDALQYLKKKLEHK